ncbi:unnamed protein product [Pipistrellus nathusii]|uniref:Uncharacterized protein n=1 Tax=Pipistrellus nathusii TaxID=59473 RepID=A0ABP0A6C1_PIPNA
MGRGGEGGRSGERGVKAGGRGTRSLQQDLKQPQQPSWLPGPRDPTASWKEFPEGNRGSSSSLSRTGKPEKAIGLVSGLGVTGLGPRLAPTEGRKLEPGVILCRGQVRAHAPPGHWPSLAAHRRRWRLAARGSPE